MGAEMKHPESDAPLAGRAGSLVTRRVRGSHRCRWKFQAGGAGCAGVSLEAMAVPGARTVRRGMRPTASYAPPQAQYLAAFSETADC